MVAGNSVSQVGRRQRHRRVWRNILSRAAVLIVLSLGAIAMLFPLVWMISSSFKPLAQIDLFPPKWIPIEQLTVEVDGNVYPLYEVELDGETRQLLMVDKVQHTGIFGDPDDISHTIEVDMTREEELIFIELGFITMIKGSIERIDNENNLRTSIPK